MSYLNKKDNQLHKAIHSRMANDTPENILSNRRLRVIPIVRDKIGSIEGVAADVGCGSGYFSIGLAREFNNLSRIDAIEASETAVSDVIPRNIDFFDVTEKVSPLFGSFDNLCVNTYDYVFAMGALHHSRNLSSTLKSISNSLKIGGYLIAQEPAMPDETTHDEYDFKYNIIEERHGLQIRNGDRFDRFFRECEYKTALIHSGFDIKCWENFINTESKLTNIRKQLLRMSNHSLNKIYKLIQILGLNNQKNKNPNDWKLKMRKATLLVKPKLFIARKSNTGKFYHSD